MSQKPASSPAEVIAAGMAMRARGVEPERPTLWNELGRRGLSKTPWDTWLEHRDRQLPVRLGIELGGEIQSPELTTAIEGHSRGLATVIACAQAEAKAPLLQRIGQLEAALTRASQEKQNLERFTDDLEAELAARDEMIATLQNGSDRPRLILP